MSQTIPASVQLGFAYVSATGIGVRTVRLDKTTVVTATTTSGVAEAPANSGQFQRAGGIEAHDEGGYIVWTHNGTDILWDGVAAAASVSISSGNVVGAIEYTYTVTNSVTGLPIEGVQIWITTDLAGSNVIWYGVTDSSGVLRDGNGGKPFLDVGTIYLFRQRAGFTWTNPDTEIVS